MVNEKFIKNSNKFFTVFFQCGKKLKKIILHFFFFFFTPENPLKTILDYKCAENLSFQPISKLFFSMRSKFSSEDHICPRFLNFCINIFINESKQKI